MLMTTLVNTFDPVFRLAVDGFNAVAQDIYTHTAGTGDIIQQWLSDVRDHFKVNSLEEIWKVVTGGTSAAISMAILAFCNLLLPDVYVLFTLAYVVVGTVLYALGQLVLALYPSGALGEYTRSYFKNLIVWGLWPVLYALFADLMTLINMNSVDKVLNAHSFVGGFVNLGSTMLLALASVVFAIAIALIPIIAHHVVSGHIGQAVATVARSLRGIKFKK
jgi:hypothetical protein